MGFHVGIDPIMGVRVNTTRYAPEWTNDGPPVQARFPRSKGRRIQKKWARRSRNFRPGRVRFVVEVEGVLIMHPLTYYALTGG